MWKSNFRRPTNDSQGLSRGGFSTQVTHCAKEFALRHLSVEVLVSLVASLSALMVVVLGKRCRRMEWPRIRLPTVGRANRDDLLLDLESPLLLDGDDYAPAPPASPPALLLPETRDRASSI